MAEIIELKGKSKASPRHENEKIPMKTNLPPPIVSLTILSTAATALLLGEKSRQKNNHSVFRVGFGRV